MKYFSQSRQKVLFRFLPLIGISLVLTGCGRSTFFGATRSTPTTPTSAVSGALETATSTTGSDLTGELSPEEVRARGSDLLERFESPTRRWFYSTDRRPLQTSQRKTGWACLNGFWVQGTEEIHKLYRGAVREDYPLSVTQGGFLYFFFPRIVSDGPIRYWHDHKSVAAEIKLPIMGAAIPPTFLMKQNGGVEGNVVESGPNRFLYKDMDTSAVKMSLINTATGEAMLNETTFGRLDSVTSVPFSAECDDHRMDLTYQTPSGPTTVRLQR